MKLLLTSLALVAVAIVWSGQRLKTAHLHVQVDSLREQARELATLRAEQDRLRALQIDASTRQELEHAVAERNRMQRELAAREAGSLRLPDAFSAGEWLPVQAWRNRGQSRPSAALETTLWAAAGGDVTTMKTLLLLDGVTRAQASELHARLSQEARTLCPTVEDLVAACTVKLIPAGEAQLVWQRETGPDSAVACIVLTEPASPLAPPSTQRELNNEKVPPTLPSRKKLSPAYLSLRRTSDGWQLVVPPSAIDKIAKDLTQPSRH